jgi:hypothetical protein
MENFCRKDHVESLEKSIRTAYETEGVYQTDTICRKFDARSKNYVDILLFE